MKKLVALMITMALCSVPALSVELLKVDFLGTPGASVSSIPAGDAQITADSNVTNEAFGVIGGTADTTNWQYNATGDALLNTDLYTAANWGGPTRFDLGLALAAAGKTYTVTNVEVDVVATNAIDVSLDLWAARNADGSGRISTTPVVVPAGTTGTFTIETSLMHLIATDHGATWNQAGNGDLRLGVYSTNGLNEDSIEIGEIRVNGTVDDFAVQTNTLWNFNTLGDTEGWGQDLNGQIVGLTASNGVLTADSISANDPQVVQWGSFAPALGYWDSMVIRIRQLDSGGSPQAWDSSGCAVVLDDEIISSELGGTGWEVTTEADGWIVASKDISTLGTTELGFLRFDPVGQYAGTNKTFEVDYVQLTSAATPPAPTPPEASNWEFNTDGDLENWAQAGNGHITGLAVSNGVLFSEAITGNDPQLIGPTVVVGSYYWTTMEVRVRQLDSGGSPVAWDETGCSVLINGNVQAALGSAGWDVVNEGGEWIVATLDISSFGSSDISSLRIDPVGSAAGTNKNFEVDYIRMNNQPTPVPPQTSWEFNTDGNSEGWTGSAQVTGLFVSNGVLSAEGVSGNDPQLNKSGILQSQGFYWTTAQIRLRQLDTNGVPITFSSAGMTSVIGGSIINTSKWNIENSGGEWVFITIGLTQFGNNNINGIRFDPVGNSSSNKNFEVDYIRFNTSLVPLVQTLEHSWEFNTPGDTEGLTNNAGISGLTVANTYSGSEKVLTCADITSIDPQVHLNGTASINAGGNAWDTMQIRVRQLAANGGPFQPWSASGTILIVNGNNLGGIPGPNGNISTEVDGWVTATMDISAIGARNIDNFRLDVVGGDANKNFEIDWIRAYSAAKPVGYDAWTYTYALSGGSAAPTADPDGDLFNNFYEYAFGGNPVDAMDIGLLPYGRAVESGGSNVLEYVYYKRSDPNVSCSLESNANLVYGGWSGLTEGVDYTVAGYGTYDAEMDAVTNYIPADLDIEFIRTIAQ